MPPRINLDALLALVFGNGKVRQDGIDYVLGNNPNVELRLQWLP